VPSVLGDVVSALPGVTTKVHVTCPQCFRVVQITAEQYVDEDGERYVDAPIVWRAIEIHASYGCVARRQ
jgi:hypothetical protein